MNGEKAKDIRHDLGRMIGKRITLRDMGLAMRLSESNAADRYRQWEQEQPTGPGSLALDYLSQGLERERIPAYVHQKGDREFLVRLHWPRFIGQVVPNDQVSATLESHSLDAHRSLMVLSWIDDPALFLTDAEIVIELARAVAYLTWKD
jgi:hypothetical protein